MKVWIFWSLPQPISSQTGEIWQSGWPCSLYPSFQCFSGCQILYNSSILSLLNNFCSDLLNIFELSGRYNYGKKVLKKISDGTNTELDIKAVSDRLKMVSEKKSEVHSKSTILQLWSKNFRLVSLQRDKGELFLNRFSFNRKFNPRGVGRDSWVNLSSTKFSLF